MNSFMDFPLFTASVTRKLQEKLGSRYRIFSRPVKKNNGKELTGIIVEEQDCNTSPTIYIDDFYDEYRKNVSIEEIVEHICQIFYKSRFAQSVDLSGFADYSKASEQIAFKLINYEKNRELLKEIPHKVFYDLAIVFYYSVKEPPFDGNASILIRNSHLKIWEISLEELYEGAMERTPEMFPAQIENIEDIIADMLGSKERSCINADKSKEGNIDMYVLSNKQKLQGASCMLYPDILRQFSMEKGSDLYILPSSVHEVILLADTGKNSARSLLEMVSDINRTQVEESEVLSDAVYYYSRSDDRIEHLFWDNQEGFTIFS